MKKNKRVNSDKSETPTRRIGRLHSGHVRVNDLMLLLYDLISVSVAFFFALWFRFDCRFTALP
ncbi:MAG: hypothetical protein J6S34_00765, partial [Clostridia bacterium]|nr:hypothetical protein [Clostridia bacterium]